MQFYVLIATMLALFGPTALGLIPVAPPSPIGRFSSTRLLDASSSDNGGEATDIVARKIIVTGDVQGGYLRACILNEAGRFRRLVGTMTPPDESAEQAEIYVEGKRKMVDGFVRWCKKADVGLSQRMTVEEVVEEDPMGLYDDFYVKTK